MTTFPTSCKALGGICFLAFPQQKNLLISELEGRFGVTTSPDKVYGDLLYYENAAPFSSATPYW